MSSKGLQEEENYAMGSIKMLSHCHALRFIMLEAPYNKKLCRHLKRLELAAKTFSKKEYRQEACLNKERLVSTYEITRTKDKELMSLPVHLH